MDLAARHCKPCERDVEPMARDEAARLAGKVPQWTLEEHRIRRTWRMPDFRACLDAIAQIGPIAEAEGHHPDLHLTGYRNLEAELTTHAIGGLSENDFIVAAKIDRVLP